MSKSRLKSGVAWSLFVAVMAAAPVSAMAGEQTKAAPVTVSRDFEDQARTVARQTVSVTSTGTSDATPADPAVIGPDGTPIVDCPDGAPSDAAWKGIPDDLRKIAHPGACYSRLLIAPRVETYTDHVVVQQARTETRTVPEVSQMAEKDVLVTPAHNIHHTIAAVTHTEMVSEIVRPASFREETIPAQYEMHTQHVMVAPEHQEWVKSAGYATGAALVTPGDHEPVRYRADGTLQWPGKDGGTVVHTSDETADYLRQGSAQTIWCLQVVPAVYRDQQVRVEVSPATTRRIEIPAVTRQVTHTVVDVPEHIEDQTVPAVYEKRRVKEIVSPAHTETVDIPAVYHDETKSRVTSEPRAVWREVLCQKNASPAVIADIQRALAAKGYDPGAIDGHLGSKTVSAMQKFEADSSLPQGQISVEAVKALGVDIQHN